METSNRPDIPQETIMKALDQVMDKLGSRLIQKGSGTFKSSHEILGVVTEEYDELIQAVRSNDNKKLEHELIDIAVACVFGLASILNDTTDW